MTKESTNNRNLIDKTFAKISHFIAWFVLGSMTSFGGFLLGTILWSNTFRAYGETIIFVSYLMVVSSIL